MMKKILKSKVLILLILCIVSVPINIEAASPKTLNDMYKELNSLKSQKTENDNKTYNTEKEIATKNQDIAKSYEAIEQAKIDIQISEKRIEESNKEIEKLSETAAELMLMYEKLQNQDTYLSFVTGANSLTDLIMRIDAITQLMDYNQETIVKLENLIKENKAEKTNLIKTQETLEKNIKSYEKKIDSLENDLRYFSEIVEDIDDQIKNLNSNIKHYENLGCKPNQDLDECVAIANNASWLKPLNYGYITSGFGYRYIWGKYSFHNGIDMGGNREGTPVYASVSGTVAALTWYSSCGGNKVYIHSYVDGKPYTTAYFHLLTINVKVGDKVTTDTKIGTVGGGAQTKHYDRCSTGAHLHFTVANGFYLGGGAHGYSSYSTFVARSIEPPGYPNLYGSFNSRYAWTN